VGQATPTDSVYLAHRDFSKLDSAFSTAGAALTPAQSFTSAHASSPGTSPRMSSKGMAKYARSLYLAGLRGMLAEMRGVRPHGTPYGHTQQLTARFNPGQARSKVSGTALLACDAIIDGDKAVTVLIGACLIQSSCTSAPNHHGCCPLLLAQATRLAVSRAHPPLAACARVWALRQGPLGRLEPGSWASAYHLAAAVKERVFWSKVCHATVVNGIPVGLQHAAAAAAAAAQDAAVLPCLVVFTECATATLLPARSSLPEAHTYGSAAVLPPPLLSRLPCVATCWSLLLPLLPPQPLPSAALLCLLAWAASAACPAALWVTWWLWAQTGGHCWCGGSAGT
jgi:hypothetical protein